jgi:hypothetical protein
VAVLATIICPAITSRRTRNRFQPAPRRPRNPTPSPSDTLCLRRVTSIRSRSCAGRWTPRSRRCVFEAFFGGFWGVFCSWCSCRGSCCACFSPLICFSLPLRYHRAIRRLFASQLLFPQHDWCFRRRVCKRALREEAASKQSNKCLESGSFGSWTMQLQSQSSDNNSMISAFITAA